MVLRNLRVATSLKNLTLQQALLMEHPSLTRARVREMVRKTETHPNPLPREMERLRRMQEK
eukprot:588900-Amphidinium_carterae.1